MSTPITQDAEATDAVVDPAGSSRLLRRMTQVCVGLIAALGVDLAVDRVILRAPSETFDLAPVGKMALYTAFGFVAASVSMGVCAVGGRRLDRI